MRDALARILIFVLIVEFFFLLYAAIAMKIQLDTQQAQITKLQAKQGLLECRLKNLINSDTYYATVTAYTGLEKYTDSTPKITAFNTHVKKCGIAVSRDLLGKGFKKNKTVFIPRFGYCAGHVFVNDKMNKRKRMQIDLYFDTEQEAIDFGIKRNVKIMLIKRCQ
jgi:3D (Asp-Asp-Asp) domain-containing protein